MPLSDVLVCLDGTDAGDRRLELALNLAQADRAYLIAACLLPEPRISAAAPAAAGLPPTVFSPVSPEGAGVIGGEPMDRVMPADEVSHAADATGAIEQRFRGELPLRELNGEWQVIDHTGLGELLRLAKTADLTILGQYPGNDIGGALWLQPDQIMIEIGRPVLIIPYNGAFATIGKRVLVAWDGTREANRALHDALQVIRHAEAVTVMHLGGRQADLDRDRPALERIIHHLRRHGLTAEGEERLYHGTPVCDALLSRAVELGADLIVAGAYHHSPAREHLLGGVSRGLLHRMNLPVLMSH
jgi:nucleotide-binding universal stress UspA family protein